MEFDNKRKTHADSISAIRTLVPNEISSPFQTGKKDQTGGILYNPPTATPYPSDAKYQNSAALGSGAVPRDSNEFAIGSEVAVLSPVVYGNVRVHRIGSGYEIREGQNARMGIGTLSGAGTFIIYNTSIRADTRIFMSGQNSSGVHGELTISARTPHVQCTVASSSAADTRDVAWVMFAP